MFVSAASVIAVPVAGHSGTTAQLGWRKMAMLVILACGFYKPAQAQNPAWSWLAHSTENSTAVVQKVTTDAAGNAYVTGRFTKRIAFGSFVLQSAGSSDIFVAKVTVDGRWQWAVSAGGTAADMANSIAVTQEGDVVVAGAFQESARFGPLLKQSRGSDDVFVATLTPTGDWLSVMTAGGVDQDQVLALTLDTKQNVYVGGRFRGTAAFGGSSLNSFKDDAFVAKLGPQGQWQWAIQTHSSELAAISSLSVDKAGALYAAGYFAGATVFGHLPLVGAGTHDAFVAKISAAGNWQWATPGGGASTDYAKGIAVNDDGNIYVTGSFSGHATFGASELASLGGDDAYVAQLSAQGKWQWIHTIKSNALDNGSDVSIGVDGSIYVSGSFSQGAQYNGSSLPNNGHTDVFVTRLSKEGQFLDMLSAGSIASDEAQSVAAGPNGSVYLVGNVGAATRFGNAGTSENSSQIFISKVEFPTRLTADI